MLEGYICKIATLEDIEKNWEYLIEIHPDNNAWKVFREETIKNFKKGNIIVYYGFLNGEIISEATAMMDGLDVINTEGLVDKTTIYLSAFRTRKELRGKGYFSELFKFMENDLKNRGYKRLTLGVEPSETKNKSIYFKYGFTNFIKSEYEVEPPKIKGEEPKEYLVEYYCKDI